MDSPQYFDYVGRRDHIVLLAILTIAFLIRLGIPVLVYESTHNVLGFYSYDSLSYIQPAQELLNTGHFANQQIPDIYRTPGYPLLLIPGIWIGQIEVITILLQLILGVLNIYIVYRIGLILFRKSTIAFLAGALMAIEPLANLYGSKILSETLFCTAVLLFILFICKYLSGYQFQDILLGAFFLGISVYIRPITYYLTFFITGFLLVKSVIGKVQRRIILLHVLLFLIVSFGLTFIWQVRNYIIAGTWEFSSISDINLYFFHGASVAAVHKHIPLVDMQNEMGYRDPTIYYELHPDQKSWPVAKQLEYFKAQGLGQITGDIPTFVKIYLIGTARTLFDPGANEYLRLFGQYSLPGGIVGVGIDKGIGELVKQIKGIFEQHQNIFIANLALFIILLIYYLFFLFGILKSRVWRDSLLFFPLVVGIYLIILSGGASGADRFRMPVMPILCLFAGYGMNYWIEKKLVYKR